MRLTGHLMVLVLGLIVLAGSLVAVSCAVEELHGPRWMLFAGIIGMGVMVGWLIWAISILSAFGYATVGP